MSFILRSPEQVPPRAAALLVTPEYGVAADALVDHPSCFGFPIW